VEWFVFFAIAILSACCMECCNKGLFLKKKNLTVHLSVNIQCLNTKLCYFSSLEALTSFSFCFIACAQETRAIAQCGHLCALTCNSEESQIFRVSFSEFYSSRNMAVKNSRKLGLWPPYSVPCDCDSTFSLPLTLSL
jgi:hypothetical protein